MPQNPPVPNGNGTTPGRLDGWKEIAAYIGRGVRTAQRWERDVGLPVRRLGTGGGEVVYAFRSELDAWLADHSRLGSVERERIAAESALDGDGHGNGSEVDANGRPPQTGPGADAASGAGTSVGISPVEAPQGRRWSALRILSTAAALVAFVAGSLWFSNRQATPAEVKPAGSNSAAPPAEPTTLEVSSHTLHVLGPNLEVLWSRGFDVPLDDFDAETPEKHARWLRWFTAIRDLNGDGHQEVLVLRHNPDDLRLYCFDHSGQLSFTHEVSADVRFGEYRCTKVRPNRLYASAAVADPGTFWMSGHDSTGFFPSVLQLLDPQGRVRSEYWSAGFISSVAKVEIGGKRLTLVGGCANETGGAALAVFEGPVNGSSPAANPAYRCTGCSAGGPLHYLIFPRSRLQAELDHVGQIFEIRPGPGDTIVVTVIVSGHAEMDDTYGLAYYTLDSDFRIVHVEQGGNFGMIQRRFEADRLVTSRTRFHGPSDFYPVLRWNGEEYDRITGVETTRARTTRPEATRSEVK
jgi:hypothetical protein